jgi:hypothetical protein
MIYGVIGARLAGERSAWRKGRLHPANQHSYMRRFKRSRSIRAVFCCWSLARLTRMANREKDESIKKIGLVTS